MMDLPACAYIGHLQAVLRVEALVDGWRALASGLAFGYPTFGLPIAATRDESFR
jgi:hypothetical protein